MAWKSEIGVTYLLLLPDWAVRQLNMDVLEHAPYIPDLAHSKYHVFGPLKIAVNGRHSTSDQRVKGGA